YPQIKVQIAIGSLPRYFRRSRASFPSEPYLVADPVRVERWRRRFDTDSKKLNVGIAWRGGTYQTRSELRSTKLRDWLPIFAVRSARFHALQAGTAEELAEAQLPSDVLRELEGVARDFDELAAAMTALDLVITVQ